MTDAEAPMTDLAQRVEAALKSIDIYPGSSWPDAFTVEGALLRDVYARRGESPSPWEGGTLAAAKFIAGAPNLIRDLWADHQRLEKELARWQVCENCGEKLTGPGICDRAVGEHAKGLEEMLDQTLTRAEAAEARATRLEEALKNELGEKV